ncbi:ParD-like family protein [Alkalimarinus coralli]|uniref:ParD-like family protein n=1 Tax=Alkalimarinus coralli TaxID=2935863 RepID=UPI00202ACA28|nr:ParD-like family protein [Alkalimarinus coralli]
MATSIRLSDDLMADAEVYASASNRTIPKQIEHWAKIGRVMEENPDLSYEFVSDVLVAEAEIKAGRVKKYVRRKDRN